MFSQKKGAWGNVPSIILMHDYTGLTQYLRRNFPGIAKSSPPPFTGFQFTGGEKYKIFHEIEPPPQEEKTTHGYKNLKTHNDGNREIYMLLYSLHRPNLSSIQQNIESLCTAEAMK